MRTGTDGAAKDVFALFFVLSLLVPVSRLIRGIVHEKETRVREGMKMMVRHAHRRTWQTRAAV